MSDQHEGNEQMTTSTLEQDWQIHQDVTYDATVVVVTLPDGQPPSFAYSPCRVCQVVADSAVVATVEGHLTWTFPCGHGRAQSVWDCPGCVGHTHPGYLSYWLSLNAL